MIILSSFKYKNHSIEDDIIYISGSNSFANYTTYPLRYFYNNNKVEFHAYYIVDDIITNYNYISYAIIAFILLMTMGSFLSFLYNKKEGTKTDDADWTVIALLGLNVSDFIGDILLSYEILCQFGDPTRSKRDLILLNICGASSITFLILPYFVSIYTTWKFEQFITGNKSAILHFQQYRALFILIMLVSGSTYISALLLSSKIFALDIFCSGLTKYEIGKLLSLKVFGAVLLENLPQ
eukprot:423340_1